MAKRRRGAPGGRRHQTLVRFNDTEQILVAAAADGAGLTVARLIAETVLLAVTGRDRLTVAERRDLTDKLWTSERLLRALGNNVNQLARIANSTGVISMETTHTMRAVADLIERLDAVLDDLDGHL